MNEVETLSGKCTRLRCLALIAGMILSAGVAGKAAAAPRKPNILFMITDDQRFDALGVVQKEQGKNARWPWFKTPAMDRIANEGVRFRNAFVVHSLCSPSRASFLTGMYGHRDGIMDNSTQFASNVVNVAEILRTNGYNTAYIGKFHMAFEKDRPGFDYYASYVSQGEYWGSTFSVNGTPRKATNWVDDVATDYAIDYIKSHTNDTWFMMFGFKTVHTPRQPRPEYTNLFAGDYVAKARNYASMPSYGRGQRAFKGEEIGKPYETDTDSFGGDPYLLNYFRCIASADDDVGRVLKTLDDLHLARDTVVIFAGDNGYYLGDHGLGDKRSAYEESMRIPMLFRYPRLQPRTHKIDQMVLNIDLAPTLLDLAGVPIPDNMQGMSWIPLLKGHTSDWRRAFLYEYFFEPGLPATPPMLAVRTDNNKLIEYPHHEDWTELFDLKRDPYETNNLAKNPTDQDLLRHMQALLKEQKEKFGDPFAVRKQ